jgi:hypothetical protein
MGDETDDLRGRVVEPLHVVGLITRAVDEIVEIEDCYWLDAARVPISELRARRLRVVTRSIVDA